MRALSLLGFYGYLLAGMVLGIRLLLMWRRTRQLPELMFSMGFLLTVCGISALVVRLYYAWLIPDVAWLRFVILTTLFGASGAALARVIATWRIFQPDARWAQVLVAVLGMALVGRYFDALDGNSLPRWFDPVVQGSAFAWMAWEAFRYHARLRRRLRLGLADPVVMDRIWLWGCSGALITFLNSITLAGVFLPAISQPRNLSVYIPAVLILNAFCSWLAFYPPRAYLRIVERRALATGAPA